MHVAVHVHTCTRPRRRKLLRSHGRTRRAVTCAENGWRRVANWPTVARLGTFVGFVAALAAPAAPWDTFGRIAWLYASLAIALRTWERHVRVEARPWTRQQPSWRWNVAKEACLGWCGGAMAVVTLLLCFHNSKLAHCTRPPTSWTVHLVYGTCMGWTVAWMEEWLFRGWLVDELKQDVPRKWAKLLSAILFGVAHGSMHAWPGMVVLALGLSAARDITQGRIALPMGLHAGLVGTYYSVNAGGVLVTDANKATWLTGHAHGNPLAGAIGLCVVSMLSAVLHVVARRGRGREPDRLVQIT